MRMRLAVIAAAALIGGCGPVPESEPARPKISAEGVAQCRELLAMGERIGLIRARPKPNRINVDEMQWQQLDADVKDRTLQAVACDLWQVDMPPSGEMVVAYGARSGKRIQMLTEVGMVRE